MWLGSWLSVCMGEVSAYGRLRMQCLYVAGIMTECLLRRGVHFMKVKNAVFVCGWDHDWVSAKERCLLAKVWLYKVMLPGSKANLWFLSTWDWPLLRWRLHFKNKTFENNKHCCWSWVINNVTANSKSNPRFMFFTAVNHNLNTCMSATNDYKKQKPKMKVDKNPPITTYKRDLLSLLISNLCFLL